jgi:hypothetical protein
MRILNTGVDTAKHDTQEIFEGLQAERSRVVTQVRDLQLAVRLLLQAEARRLAGRGGIDARVAMFSDIERTVRARVAVLDTEQEVAAIRVPPVAKTDALVHGRITDDAERAAGRVTVTLLRADGSAVPGVKPVTLDDAGYYAFVIDPQTAAALGAGEKLSVAVQRGDSVVVPGSSAGFTLAGGAVAVKDVALNDAELQKLQLRAKVVAGTAVRPVAPRAATSAKVAPAKSRGGKPKK